MEWKSGIIEGVEIRKARKFTDQRGWLAEIYRSDETDSGIMPAMCYVSITHPGISRGPHAHRRQTDLFAFFGPGNFRLKMWDNRKESPTHGTVMTVAVGEDNPAVVVLPPGIVHGYTNVSRSDAVVINLPNSLYAGHGRKEPVDEVRYEDLKDSPFTFDD